MSGSVVILEQWRSVPVFHVERDGLVREVEEQADGSRKASRRSLSACGQIIMEWGWTEPPSIGPSTDHWDRHRGFWLRRDHAEKFGRLCRLCERTER